MKEITMDKGDLIAKIHENKATHIKEYNEMMEVYMKMAIKAAGELVQDLKDGKSDTSLYIDLTKPKSNETEYNTALEMLELEISTNVTISENEFKQYIKDEWNFSRSFATSKMAYLAGK